MQKLKFEQVGVSFTSSLKFGIYYQGDQCQGIGWHIHPEYEVVYIKNGKGILNIGAKQIPYSNGILLFLGPEIPHTDFGNADFADALEVVVQFDERFVTERIRAFPEFRKIAELAAASRQALIFSEEGRNNLASSFEAIPGQCAEQRLLTFLNILFLMSSSTTYKALYSSKDVISNLVKPADLQRLEQVFRRVNETYHQPLTSALMAAEMGITTNSFCRFFKSSTGKTFTRFLNEFRLERAKEMLRTTSESVQYILYSCGFRDASYFSRLFNRFVGLSPLAYREAELLTEADS